MELHIPDEHFSTGALYEQFAQDVIDDYDSITPTPMGTLLKKVGDFRVSELFENATEQIQKNYSDMDRVFREVLLREIEENTHQSDKNKGQTRASVLIEGFFVACDKVRNDRYVSRQLGNEMIGTIGDFLRHFDVPVSVKIVCELELGNPELAKDYKERAKRWIEGID